MHRMINDGDFEPLRPNQFRLRTAFALLTICAVLFAVWRHLPFSPNLTFFTALILAVGVGLILILLFLIARSPQFESCLIIGWIGTWFAGAIYGVLMMGMLSDGQWQGLLVGAGVGFIWAAIVSQIGLIVASILVVLLKPRTKVWPSMVCGGLTGAVSMGGVLFSGQDPSSMSLLASVLLPTVVGSAVAAFATIVT
jgi:hypothetical protein